MTPATTHGRAATQAGTRLSADERRAEIVEAAVMAFASGGLAGTSTEDIARLAGVSQPYLFRLFGTKRDLFIAAVGRAFDRITAAFERAARNPEPIPPGMDLDVRMTPVLWSMGMAYHQLVQDESLLRLQLHAFAACDDPEVREFTRVRFAALVARVSELSGADPAALRGFFAEGMLKNVSVAMRLTDLDTAWQRMCVGEGAY
jgi:AcrR family transcriptional regulator